MVWAKDGTFHCFSSARIDHHAVYTDGDYTWTVPAEGPNKGKVTQVLPDGAEVKPAFDMSITKNVCALWISVLVVLAVCFPVARWHKKHGFEAPRRLQGRGRRAARGLLLEGEWRIFRESDDQKFRWRLFDSTDRL